MLRSVYLVVMSLVCTLGIALSDDNTLTPPKFNASIVCFNGKVDSGSSCHSTMAVVDDGQQRVLFEDKAQCILIKVESEKDDVATMPTPNDTVAVINPNGEIRGRLMSMEGQPIAGATIALGFVAKVMSQSAYQPADGIETVTRDDGSYRLLAPAPGVYIVWLKKHPDPRMTAAADDGLIVKGGEITESALCSVPLRRVRGRVIDEAGTVVGDANVSYRSVARPGFDLPSQSVTTDVNGSFEFLAPAGKCVLHATQVVPTTEANPFGVGQQASLRIDIPTEGKSDEVFEAERLVLTSKSIGVGETSWTQLTTPGTQVVRQENAGSVKGVVLSSKLEPIAGATVVRYDGISVTTNAAGEFELVAEPKSQFVMYAAAVGHHLWSGTPAAGDVLRIVLENR